MDDDFFMGMDTRLLELEQELERLKAQLKDDEVGDWYDWECI